MGENVIHSVRSPSSRYRRVLCAGSVREAAKYPERKSSPSAIDGTHTHSLLEHCTKAGVTAASMIGQYIIDHEGTFTVDAERAERVQFALDYIASRVAAEEGVTVVSEKRVDPVSILGRDDMSGTVDVQLLGSTGVELIDYKDGINPIEAKDNEQLTQYAFGVISEAMQAGKFYQTVRMTVVQPKARLKGSSGIDSHEITVTDLLSQRDTIIAQEAACDDPNAPLTPGEKQCKYCPAKGNCNAVVQEMFGKLDVSFDDLSQQAADKNPNEMSDEEIKKILEAAPLLRQLIEGAEGEALRRFEAGSPISGLKAVRGRGSRAWALPEEEMAERLRVMRMPTDVVWPKKLISVAQAEKAVWENKKGEKCSLTEIQISRLKKEYITSTTGKLTIVAESDARPAVETFNLKDLPAVPVAPSETLPSWLI